MLFNYYYYIKHCLRCSSEISYTIYTNCTHTHIHIYRNIVTMSHCFNKKKAQRSVTNSNQTFSLFIHSVMYIMAHMVQHIIKCIHAKIRMQFTKVLLAFFCISARYSIEHWTYEYECYARGEQRGKVFPS